MARTIQSDNGGRSDYGPKIQIQSYTGDFRYIPYRTYQIGAEDTEKYEILLVKNKRISNIDVCTNKAVRDMVITMLQNGQDVSLRMMRSPTLGYPAVIRIMKQFEKYDQRYLATAVAKAQEARNKRGLEPAPIHEWDCFEDYNEKEVYSLLKGIKVHVPLKRVEIVLKLAACLGSPKQVLETGITPEQFYEFILK